MRAFHKTVKRFVHSEVLEALFHQCTIFKSHMGVFSSYFFAFRLIDASVVLKSCTDVTCKTCVVACFATGIKAGKMSLFCDKNYAPTDTALLTVESYFIYLFFCLSPDIKLCSPCQEVKGNNFRLDKYFNVKTEGYFPLIFTWSENGKLYTSRVRIKYRWITPRNHSRKV